MAPEVQENNNYPSGIKLFGATISIKHKSQQPNNIIIDHQDRPNQGDDDDQTVEKRPDKIIPCPRCKSMDTKFCYFNNYNVNQPRHFCKGCQRYWTAGGALRNVPVGAGRRKIKPPCRGLPDGGLFDESDGAEHGGYGQFFAAKRRRFAANSQSC